MGQRKKLTYKLLSGVLPIISIMAVISLLAVISYFTNQFQKMIENHQQDLVERAAEKIDSQLDTLQKTVISIASVVPVDKLNSPKQLEQFLDSRPGIRHMFDNNFAIYSTNGRLIAELSARPSRTGMDFSYRDYIIKTREGWKPYISMPFISKLAHNHPAIMFTAPVFDANHQPVAIVGGSIDLYNPNMLGKLASIKIGKDGYFYLSDVNRTMIMHPDRDRIMSSTVPAGVNKLYDKALSGFEGAGTTVNSKGIPYIAAFKRIKLTGWVLAAQIPTKEAFAPVRKARYIGWLVTIIGISLTGILIYLNTRRLTAPLELLTEQIKEISSGSSINPITIRQDDEVGDLAVSFTSLMHQLQARERDLNSSRELYQFLSDFSSDWIFWRVPSGEMIYISPAAERITGYSVNELMSEPNLGSSITHPDDQELWNDHICKANQSAENDLIEYRIIRKDGQTRWISHTCRTIFDNNGRPIGVRGCNTDITASKIAESALKESEERFRLIASAAHDAIVMADKKGLITFWNSAAARIFGMPAERAIGLSLELFLTKVSNELQTSFLDLLFSPAMIAKGGTSVEVSGVNHQTGATPMLEVSVSTARLTGKTFAIMLIRDITDRKEAEEQLQYISLHDPLTGLQNRAAFEQELIRLKHSELFPVSIIMADLDGLKTVNDTKGHEAGDRLLKEAAKLLYSSFRLVDTVARVGGDEFLILLPGMDEQMANAKLDHIRNLLEFAAADQMMPKISMSLGTATALNADQLQTAIKQADSRMYQEKFSRRSSS